MNVNELDANIDEAKYAESIDDVQTESRDVPQEIYRKYIGLATSIQATHFLTITFHPKNKMLFQMFKPTAQLNATRKEVVQALKASCLFMVIPEMTLNGKIHYHAIIKIIDKIKWYKQTIYKLNSWGRIDLQPIKDMDNCYKYLLKENEQYCKVFDKNYIVYHNGTSFRLSENFITEVQELNKVMHKNREKNEYSIA